jgi:hypothetical protein
MGRLIPTGKAGELLAPIGLFYPPEGIRATARIAPLRNLPGK